MSHWPVLPILIPLAAAVAALFIPPGNGRLVRAVSVGAAAAGAIVACLLLTMADEAQVYRLGNWPSPYAIVLVLDRLAALMIAITAALALAALAYVTSSPEPEGRYFHVLFQLQIAGLSGAFLTGDLFNLFVFFEILLLASYALLLHGGGAERARAGLIYVTLNFAGSACFLMALGLIYGTLGTLNMADMALVLGATGPENQALVGAAVMMLVAVFVLKAALFPLASWLPHVYVAASAPVAALFAILTKVGVYVLLRVSVTVFDAAPFAANIVDDWLIVLGLATLAIGTVGTLAAARLSTLAAHLVLISSGMLLTAVGASHESATAALLYYLPHTILVSAGLFLLAGFIAEHRGELGDTIRRGPQLPALALTGGMFLILAVAASGIPPLSGFVGKLMLMQAAVQTDLAAPMWILLLLSSFLPGLALARAASALFWEPVGLGEPAAPPVSYASRGALFALALLAGASPALTIAAAPVSAFAAAAAEQLHQRSPYLDAVLGERPRSEREGRP